MFIDADVSQVLACSEIGADAVELHTGKYAKFFKENGANSSNSRTELGRILNASQTAIQKEILLNAGHGLDYDNTEQICKISGMNEFNIGFSIVARAIFTGLATAVKDMKELINED